MRTKLSYTKFNFPQMWKLQLPCVLFRIHKDEWNSVRNFKMNFFSSSLHPYSQFHIYIYVDGKMDLVSALCEKPCWIRKK